MRRNLPVLQPGEQLLLTHSEMACFRDCQRRWAYRYMMRRVARRVAHALWFGTSIHLCLETYWNCRKASRATKGDATHLQAGLAAIPKDASEYDAVRMHVMLSAYAAMWNPVPGTVLHTELPFNLPLLDPDSGEPHPVFRRAGKIDLVLGYGRNGAVLVEHKTTASDASEGSDYRRRLTIDEQLSHYTAALDAMNLPVVKIVYDVLLKPDVKPLLATPEEKRVWVKPKPPKKPRVKKPKKGDVTPDVASDVVDGISAELNEVLSAADEPRIKKGQRLENESMDAFRERLIAKWSESPEKYVFRIPVERLKSEREEWLHEVWDQAELMRFAAENAHYPKNSRSCLNHYGAPCDYLPVCEGHARIDDDSRYALLEDAHPELRVESVTA